jgi:hypothetical protein
MHIHVSDVLALVALLMVLFLFPLIEKLYPLWVEAVIVVCRVNKHERRKRVAVAYQNINSSGSGGKSSEHRASKHR